LLTIAVELAEVRELIWDVNLLFNSWSLCVSKSSVTPPIVTVRCVSTTLSITGLFMIVVGLLCEIIFGDCRVTPVLTTFLCGSAPEIGVMLTNTNPLL